MICLFCRQDSTDSRSVEHIIPESLGNHELILPPGIVCDQCNNYFSREVERPFLESGPIFALRFHEALPSKKGKIPPSDGILLPQFPVRLFRDFKAACRTSMFVPPEAFAHILKNNHLNLVLPAPSDPPQGPILSRFMAKVALEAMALRLVGYPDGIEYISKEAQLDAIRNHARRGEVRQWPVHMRRIYDHDAKWSDESDDLVQLVHETDILKTGSGEWYFVLALFGLELVINYGGAEIDGYQRWLIDNGGKSPLYLAKNENASGLKPIG